MFSASDMAGQYIQKRVSQSLIIKTTREGVYGTGIGEGDAGQGEF